MNYKRVLCTAAVASLAFGVYAATPVFRHRFDSAKDDSGRYTGQAMSGAVLTKIGDEGIVDLGTAGGWFDFGTSLGDIIRNLKGDYANADGTKGRYMIYYSLLTNDGKCTYDKVYYSYANDDFTGLLTDPVYFYDRGSATIDCDIVWDETTQLFHMFFKNEGSGGICKVTAKSLLPEPGQPDGSQWSKPSPTLQCTGEAVEGAGVFPLINSDKWILMYDCYMNGHYQFCETEDLDNFTLRAETATSGAFTPRHGTVIPLTPEETERLLQKFPAAAKAANCSGNLCTAQRTRATT